MSPLFRTVLLLLAFACAVGACGVVTPASGPAPHLSVAKRCFRGVLPLRVVLLVLACAAAPGGGGVVTPGSGPPADGDGRDRGTN